MTPAENYQPPLVYFDLIGERFGDSAPSPAIVQNAIDQGRIRYERIDGRLLLNAADVQALINRRKRPRRQRRAN